MNRSLRGQPDYWNCLREEILAAVSRHVELDPDKVVVKMERGETVSTLEVDIELPSGCARLIAAGRLTIRHMSTSVARCCGDSSSQRDNFRLIFRSYPSIRVDHELDATSTSHDRRLPVWCGPLPDRFVSAAALQLQFAPIAKGRPAARSH